MPPPPPPSSRLLATAVLALAAVVPSLTACGSEPRPTGVLLVSIDSLRADSLSCYGYESSTRPEIATSPEIDARLAAEGTQFERVVSTTSWTLPAHMALFTGLPNELHRVRDYPDALHESTPVLAELFARAGWRTGGFFSGPNLHPVFGFGRGFEVYEDCGTAAAFDTDLFERSLDEVGQAELRELHESSHQGVTGPRVLESLGRWLADVSQNERFFAFAHLWDVHYDYTPPPEFDRFDPDYRGPVDGTHLEYLSFDSMTRADVLHLRALYDGEILFTDHVVGRMLELLEAIGRLDDTLVVLTSDHGEEFGEHGSFGHRLSLYEELVRIPLILRWPAGVPADAQQDVLASLVDVAPTVLDLCGLPRPRRMWGRSLVPALSDELPDRPAPMELTVRRFGSDLRGLHAGDWKALRQGLGPLNLTSLEKDAVELRYHTAGDAPLWTERANLARRTWRTLDELSQTFGVSSTGALSAALARDLAAAGYAGFEDADASAQAPAGPREPDSAPTDGGE